MIVTPRLRRGQQTREVRDLFGATSLFDLPMPNETTSLIYLAILRTALCFETTVTICTVTTFDEQEEERLLLH